MADSPDISDDTWQRLVAGLKPLAKKAYMPYVPPTKVLIKRHALAESPPLVGSQKQASYWHNLHRREQKRLGRGDQTPEATLDLHGQTLAVAHTQLRQFISASVRAQYRLVLVITGKGTLSTGAEKYNGALRRALPLWLHDGALQPFVIGFRAAHGKHGGEGAFYVVLRGS